MNRVHFRSAIAVIAVATAASCGKKQAAGPPLAFAVQVVAVEARAQPIFESVPLVGSIAANETVEVKSETDGIVSEIAFNEGQRVEKGLPLVILDETKFAAAVNEAEANFKLSQTTFDRSKQLFRDKLISQQEYDQAAATFSVSQANLELRRRQLKDARVYAPFSGTVGARQISPGQVISRTTTLTWLVDLDTVKVEVKVPEKYLGQLKVGQPLEFNVAAFPDEKFTGNVYFISPQLDENTRTALVKARIPNPQAKLKGGMFASLDLRLQLRNSAIVIPEPAIVNNGDATMVFVVNSTTNAVVRPVKIGMRLAGKAEVLAGLTAGEKVVVEGVQKLRPGAPVRLAPAESAAPYLN
jgi:membrane fusion protein (multidrug efflux system)